jgi:hypothetical protein
LHQGAEGRAILLFSVGQGRCTGFFNAPQTQAWREACRVYHVQQTEGLLPICKMTVKAFLHKIPKIEV